MSQLRLALSRLRATRTLLSHARHLEPHTPAEQLAMETELVRLSREEYGLLDLLHAERRRLNDSYGRWKEARP